MALEIVVSKIFEKTCKLIFSVVCFLFCFFLAKEAQLLQWLLERKGDNTRHNLVIKFQYSCTWYVEMGWGIHDFFGDLRMISLTCSSAAREKVSWHIDRDHKRPRSQAVRLFSIKLIPQSLDLCLEEIYQHTDLGDQQWGWSSGLMGGCFLFSFPTTGAWDPYQKNCSRSCWTHSYLPAVTVSSPYHDIMCLDWDGDIVVKSIMIQLQDCCSPFRMAFTWTGVN